MGATAKCLFKHTRPHCRLLTGVVRGNMGFGPAAASPMSLLMALMCMIRRWGALRLRPVLQSQESPSRITWSIRLALEPVQAVVLLMMMVLIMLGLASETSAVGGKMASESSI